ncbi:hypothetical protein SMACR_07285 [Sordaria macrospora]|uniref:WGS project CABT00000000 data, contig 2.44 n=2 Tax=Sordaria macrospora TaxID=5147 RepID=F7W8D1_SORMK|nr:uncharacterized protein SMAC_07285 [Sordaria macrospora k-hell]KAA8630322.1 hypothetical protein SMACR_07285 [Sordaria macrospora]KAH7625333.1 cutinase-domain-containing protein [Sordaria sp. MPI-SDFR-AT-0083]WPJ62679.1 hypothetical protein SMAC4_07285 [Sordaria macrospora]CCC13776.1 unnamed protein product [Sordaria macrospora k-hell]
MAGHPNIPSPHLVPGGRQSPSHLKYEDNWFLDKSYRPKLLNFFTKFRRHFSSENSIDDFSILRQRGGDEVVDKLNAMFDVIKNSTDEDPRLSEDFLEYINGRDTNFGRGMNMQRNFIDNKFEPDPERPEAGHWKLTTFPLHITLTPVPVTMKLTTIALLTGFAAANPLQITPRQSSCPKVHIFGARETTVAQGYGTSAGLVNSISSSYPGSTKEAIVYPACGGQSSCGGVSYENSASQGTAAVVKAVTSLNQRCPDTKIVLVGYSQGGQIMDNALCGGAGATLTGNALKAVKAAIFMGDPHYVDGLPYNVGTCRNKGFAARPSGFQCSPASPSIIQSYCDSTDPYCCNGNDANSHQQYVNKYGTQALAFVKKLVDAA